MAITKAFKLAELIRHIEYDSSDDVIKTSKRTEDKNKKRGSDTKTATTEFNLDTFAHADFKAARYIVAMSRGTDFHSTEIMLVHDGTTVSLTQYGVLVISLYMGSALLQKIKIAREALLQTQAKLIDMKQEKKYLKT